MNWCFAIINGGLAEIFFEKKVKKIKFLGHCFVKIEEYKTKKELEWIDEDTKRHKFTYRKEEYKRLNN